MIRDIPFEAAFLRAGLLVGLVHERDVPGWAMDAIASAPDTSGPLADVALTPCELSAMREALRRPGEGVEGSRVVAALLTAMAVAPASRSAADWLRVLGHVRYEYRPAPSIAGAIKEFEDRAMLTAAGSHRTTTPSTAEIMAWLDRVRPDGYFCFSFQDADEAAAFVAALSRKVVRNRTWTHHDPRASACAWVVRVPGGQHTVVLNERAWQTVVQEFSPIPLSSHIPYATLPAGATAIIDEDAATPLGVDEAQRVIAG